MSSISFLNSDIATSLQLPAILIMYKMREHDFVNCPVHGPDAVLYTREFSFSIVCVLCFVKYLELFSHLTTMENQFSHEIVCALAYLIAGSSYYVTNRRGSNRHSNGRSLVNHCRMHGMGTQAPCARLRCPGSLRATTVPRLPACDYGAQAPCVRLRCSGSLRATTVPKLPACDYGAQAPYARPRCPSSLCATTVLRLPARDHGAKVPCARQRCPGSIRATLFTSMRFLSGTIALHVCSNRMTESERPRLCYYVTILPPR